MTQYIYTAIAEALSELTQRPVQRVTGDMRFDRDFDLDSYMFVQFLLSLEDKIPGLRFDPEAIGQAGFNKMESLAAYIAERASTPEVAEHA
ncbi:MAG: acyl carrier protein [Paracoccaceae bacterium]